MIITISGLPGAGKSTLAQNLAKHLGWPCYSMGDLRRQTALAQGLTIAEFNQLGEKDPVTDTAVDEYQTKLGQTQDNFVIEGRNSWHFIPQSFKIFLTVDPKVGAKRIWHDLQISSARNEGRDLNSLADVLASNEKRVASDKFRYQKYFQIETYNPDNYDYVLDTSSLSTTAMLDKILAQVVPKLKM